MTPALDPLEPRAPEAAGVDPAGSAAGAAWGERYARQPAPPAAPAGPAAAADAIGDDYYTDDMITGAAIALPGLVLKRHQYAAYEKAVTEELTEDGRILKLLEHLKLGRALAELGIRPSKGLARLPAWARALGGLGALTFVVTTGVQAAMEARPAPDVGPGRNGMAHHEGEAPSGG